MTASKPSTQVKIVEVPTSRDGQRLDNFLLARLPGVPKSLVYRIIRKGQVRVNGKRAKPSQKLDAGDAVRVPPVRVNETGTVQVPAAVVQQLEEAVVFEDADLIVCNKPAGIAVHGGSGIAWGLIDAFRQSRPDASLDLVHRLDRETSGCLLLTKNHTALKHLHQQFSDRDTEKRYLTLLDGKLPEPQLTVTEALGRREISGERMVVVDPEGQSAETVFRLLEHYGDYCLAEALPVTGRTHQIRVHAAHLGAACAGDSKYAPRERQEFWRQLGLRRLFLHAHAVSFKGLDGELQMFSCPLPDELSAVLNQL